MDECGSRSEYFLIRLLSSVKIQDITGFILNTESSENLVRNTLRAQVTSPWLRNASCHFLTASQVLPGQPSQTMGLYPPRSSIRLCLPWETGQVLFCFSGSSIHVFRRTSYLIGYRFNRSTDSEGSVSYIHTESLSDHWITHVGWSPWVTRNIGHCKLSYHIVIVGGIFTMPQANHFWLSLRPMATLDLSRLLKICSLGQTCRNT